jgi:Flp pilus assembly protein TadG
MSWSVLDPGRPTAIGATYARTDSVHNSDAADRRSRHVDEAGQALVEFLLVAGLLLFVLFGVTQFGLALNAANDETHLANEVARYASVNFNPAPNGQSLAAWAKGQADNTISGSAQICISFPNGTSNIGDPVRVVVSGTMNWQPIYGLAQFLNVGLPAAQSTLSGSAVMRLEASPSVYTAGCS